MDISTRTARTRSSARGRLAGMVLAFILGALLAGYGAWRFGDEIMRRIGQPVAAPIVPPRAAALPPSPMPSATATEAAQEAVQAAQIVAQQQGGLDQRLAAAEQRIARLDLQAQAASGNAIRAEGLLIAFSARRAIERGNELGFLGEQLQLRFGDAMPNAVRTITTFGRQPITLDQLVARLDGLTPELAQTNRRLSWGQLRGELAQLFVVRHESTPSPQPQLRIERARLFLQTGRVAEAVAEVRNLPGAGSAARWTRDAERYAAAQNALDLIETAAVLEPRKLRDGAGQAILAPGMTPADTSGAQ